MNTFHLVVFLIKVVVVILTFSFSLFRVEGFQPTSKAANRFVNPTSNYVVSRPVGWNYFPTTRASSINMAQEHVPSQIIVDETTQEKWRLCAGVAVLNSRNQLLVGERQGKPENWQCPQGGVDDERTPVGSETPIPKETIVEAAIRELYEETGLETNRHVILDPTFPTPSINMSDGSGFRYSTSGTSNWLTQSGLAGQQLHWTVFRCMDGRGDCDPSTMCDLSGKGGASAEFTRVEWKDIDEVVQGIWEGKRGPYVALQSLLERHANKWQEQVNHIDFSGKWFRDSSKSINLEEGLLARGLTEEEANQETKKPYIQNWERHTTDSSSWLVTTFEGDGTTPRRTLEYKTGTWEEIYQGKSTLFGETSEPITLQRQTSYVAECDACPVPIAQVTITDGPKGIEESRRYLKDDMFILRRTLWPKGSQNNPVVSVEVFQTIQ